MNIRVNRYKNPAITARTGFEGSIEPETEGQDQTPGRGLAPSWILYWRPDGSAQLWTERAPTGHVIGTPIELGAPATLSEPAPPVLDDALSTGTPVTQPALVEPVAPGIAAPVADDALWVPDERPLGLKLSLDKSCSNCKYLYGYDQNYCGHPSSQGDVRIAGSLDILPACCPGWVPAAPAEVTP